MTGAPHKGRRDLGESPRVAMVAEQLWQPVPGGSGTYVVELTNALHARGALLAGIVASHRPRPEARAKGLPPISLARSRLPRVVLYEAWNAVGWPRAESMVPGCDIVHATTWAVPGTRLPLVVTIHDLAFMRTPEHFTRRGAAYFHRALERTRRGATRVVVPSRATADDCVAAGIEASRVTVIPHGTRTIPVTSADVSSFRARHGLDREFVLWTGTREPRKNLPRLLRAFGRLAARHRDVDLVLVGPKGWGDDTQERALAAELGDRVHVTGRLSERELASAYRGARAFAFPSLWEGFGLPALEAMAYGTPVVTSRGTSMAEVCGGAGLLIDPCDERELADALERAIGPEHDDLAAAGRVQSAGFTWDACARGHEAVYAEVARW